MPVDAIRALRDVRDGDRDDLLDLCRESSVGEGSLAEGFKGGLLVGCQIAPPAGGLGCRERIARAHRYFSCSLSPRVDQSLYKGRTCLLRQITWITDIHPLVASRDLRGDQSRATCADITGPSCHQCAAIVDFVIAVVGARDLRTELMRQGFFRRRVGESSRFA